MRLPALLLALSLGLWEPALCILHCTLWVPLASHSGTMHMPGGLDMADVKVADHSAPLFTYSLARDDCPLLGSSGHAPHQPLAQAFHEVRLSDAESLGVFLMLLSVLALRRCHERFVAPRRLLRPPIALAA